MMNYAHAMVAVVLRFGAPLAWGPWQRSCGPESPYSGRPLWLCHIMVEPPHVAGGPRFTHPSGSQLL